MHVRHSSALLACCLLALIYGCSGESSNTLGNAQTALGTGRLAVRLAAAKAPELREVVVTIAKVTAHSSEAGWVTLPGTPGTIDLLGVQTTSLLLGAVDLPAGKITQLRLYLQADGPQHVLLADGTSVDLKVPSGVQSGIKIVGPFDVPACEETSITLEFDPEKSIAVHSAKGGDLWILRPVIHAKKVVVAGVGCVEQGSDVDGGIVEPPVTVVPGLPGDSCVEGADCLSGLCVENLCGIAGPGTPCETGTDCVSGVCLEDGSCSTGIAVGTGGPCVVSSDCLSNACLDGLCASGSQGAPCVVGSDCALGLLCAPSGCVSVID
ncbi:MAG: DUF4382 domain-containing protein [Deltaproteobacteria bacterium]|nr:DUF4382 domain-containing protein [Deltaproteobacteria bacterium]